MAQSHVPGVSFVSFLLFRVLGCSWWQREGGWAHAVPALVWAVLGLDVLLGLSWVCVVFSVSLYVRCV